VTTNCKLRPVRIVLLALTLGIVFAGLGLAQEAPGTLGFRPAAPDMSVAAPRPDLIPLGLTAPEPKPNFCLFGTYYEWRKDGELCRTRNTCLPPGQQISGSCPNGYDEYTYETIVCSC
jgi:hypothetical protein